MKARKRTIYDGQMDPECIVLCDAINSIPGLRTTSSCCGHGERPFRVFFKVKTLKYLPILLYHCDPCHVGFRWHCRVLTDCLMCPVFFVLESESVGEKAYQEAQIIADRIKESLQEATQAIEEEDMGLE